MYKWVQMYNFVINRRAVLSITGSSCTGKPNGTGNQLQNRYCNGVLSDTLDAAVSCTIRGNHLLLNVELCAYINLTITNILYLYLLVSVSILFVASQLYLWSLRFCHWTTFASWLIHFLLSIIDCTQPFEVGFKTDATQSVTVTAPANGNRGACLQYTQVPCSVANSNSFWCMLMHFSYMII